MARIIFIHGLNTFGDGLIHVGPIVLGPMESAWKKAMDQRGISLIAVPGMGFGPVDDQVERALSFLKCSGLLDRNEELHFVGHSMGGLIAKALAHRSEVKRHLKTVITVGTPHGGSSLSDVATDFDKTSPILHRLFKTFGYDMVEKQKVFEHFTPAKLREFSKRHPVPDGVRCVSLVCEARPEHLSVPLRVVYKKLHGTKPAASDGFIASESQAWAEQGGVFALDHFDQMGAFVHATPWRRARAKSEFDRLIDTVAKLVGSK